MRRVPTLIQKLQELAEQGKDITVLDVDLMLDYTRVLYADLLEIRKVMPSTAPAIPEEKSSTPDTTDNASQERMAAPEPEPAKEPVPAEPATPTNKLADVPDRDIRTLIGINDKYLYISELFDNDKTAYDNAIKKLNTFSSVAEATTWVEHTLQTKYHWDNEDETVRLFYELLSNSFSAT